MEYYKLSQTNIRFSSNILKRLGEELNPDLTQGLIELVKNAYDADARNCIIELNHVFDRQQENQPSLFSDSNRSQIIIIDDGNGMTDEDITNSWLLLGESTKNATQKTALGRVPVGNKGLGRLAALRLGMKTILSTVSQKNLHIRYHLEIDWSAYNSTRAVEDVPLQITQEFLSNEAEHSYTEIIIEQIERTITEREIEKFARALILLANPFTDDNLGFKPILKLNQFQKISKLVEQRYFHEAEFHLIATVDKGVVSAIIQDWKGNVLYTAVSEEINRTHFTYSMPDAVFELWIFDFESDTFSTRSSVKSAVKNWLGAFGGVHLYYNQLRVLPFGDRQERWLSDSLKRLVGDRKNPNLIGRLLVTDTSNELQQTTDRHGFVENESFLELKRFASDVFDWMAKRWQQEQNKKTQIEKEKFEQEAGASKRTLNDEVSAISDKTERERVERAVQERERKYREQEEKLRKALQLYRTLSTTGITAAVFAHESVSNPLKVINMNITTIEDRSQKLLNNGDLYKNQLKPSIDRIKKSASSLSLLSDVALRLVDHEKRRDHVSVDLHEAINQTIQLFSSFIKERDTTIHTEFEKTIYLLGSQAALESVIVNLLNNSLVAFEPKPLTERKIIIRTQVIKYHKADSGLGVEIHVLDNGTGIEGIHLDDIWLPGETTTSHGTGLGLTIVKDTIQDMNGRVEAIARSEELGGAEIIITLPILRVAEHGQ
jgi:signal transduction histidine kinase